MPVNASHIHPEAPVPFMRFPSRRSVVHSAKGIVASTQPLANEAGLRTLRAGGNAADAAVAVAAALNMTEPSSTGIGGDMFCLFYESKSKTVHALNGSGRSGAKMTLDRIRRELNIPAGESGQIPMDHVNSVTVPGAAAGWVDCVEKFGSGNLSLEQILTPAIELGEQGWPVSELVAGFWHASEGLLKRASPNGAEMLKEDLMKDPQDPQRYRAPGPGEIMKNPTLANTFRLLAQNGKNGFYTGSVAECLVQVMSDRGGHLTLEDLSDHLHRSEDERKKNGEIGSRETDAISLRFHGQGVGTSHDGQGVDVWEHPPNGQGVVALMALGLLQELEQAGRVKTFSDKDHNSAEYIHAIIEVLRIAFADGVWWVSDPSVENVPTKDLISETYLATRAKLFDPKKASGVLHHGSPAHSHSDTVYFSVTDKDGNAASFINSNYGGFGTGIIPAGCGFTLQNRGANFSLSEGHPNVLAPRKRPYHTIIPAMVTNPGDGSLHTVFGVMGGFMQPQGHVQVLLNMLVFKMNPQAALDASRICIGAGMPEDGKVFDHIVYLEAGIDEAIAEQLRAMGHQVAILEGHERAQFGRGQIIRAHTEHGQIVYSAGSDLRGDGAAVAL